MNLNDGMIFSFALDGYKISDQLPKSTDSNITYFGFIDRHGNWYIFEQNSTLGTYRYKAGTSGYTTAWGLRESNVYDYFYSIFN